VPRASFDVPRLGVFLCDFQHCVLGISHDVLVDSGYKTPIQNMDENFASDIKLAYLPEYNLIFENDV
jgi:hypothetical protein